MSPEQIAWEIDAEIYRGLDAYDGVTGGRGIVGEDAGVSTSNGRVARDFKQPLLRPTAGEVRTAYRKAYDDWWNNRPQQLRRWGPFSNICGGPVCEDYAIAAAKGINARVSIPDTGAYAVWNFQEPTGKLGEFRLKPGAPYVFSHATVQVYMASPAGAPTLIDTYDPWWRW